MFSKVLLSLYFFFQVCHLSEAPQKMRTCRKWALPPPAHSHAETWATGSGPVQHLFWPDKLFTVWKMHLFYSLPMYVSSSTSAPSPSSPRPIYCFPSKSSREARPGRQKKVPYLRYLKMSCIQSRNELPLWLHRPPNSGKYSPAVFPQDLWYSCPQYPHNAFAEFPKWMKSRIIWSLWKVKHWSSLSLHGCIILLGKVNCEKQRTGMKWTVSVPVSQKNTVNKR